jgi:O-antigen ligase
MKQLTKQTLTRILQNYSTELAMGVFFWVFTLGTFLFPFHFQVFFLGSCVIFLGCMWLRKNFVEPAFFFLLFLAQFPQLGKIYEFVMFDPYELDRFRYAEGLIDSYGLIAVDLIILAILLFALRQVLLFAFQVRGHSQLQLRPYQKIAVYCWMLYAILAVISSTLSSFFPEFSFVQTLQYLRILPVFLLTGLLFSKATWKMVGMTVVASAILAQASIGGLQFAQNLFSQPNSNAVFTTIVPESDTLFFRPSGTFVYSNEYALVLLILFTMYCTLFYDSSKSNSALQYFLLFGVALSTAAAIVLSQSRIVIVFLGVVGVTFLFFDQKGRVVLQGLMRQTRVFFFLVLSFGLLCTVILIPRVLNSIYFFDESGGYPLRAQMIEESIGAIYQQPILGYGVGTNARTLLQLHPESYVKYFPFAVHNGYLQMMLESGILATFFFFLPFLIYLRTLFTRSHQQLQSWLCGVTIAAVLSYYLFLPYYGKVDFVYLGLLAAVCVFALERTQKQPIIKSSDIY